MRNMVGEISFYGKVTSEGDIQSNSATAGSMLDMPAQTNKLGVQRMQGAGNYVGNCLQGCLTKALLTRQLITDDIRFVRSENHAKE